RNNEAIAMYDQSEFLRPRSYEEIESWSQRMVEGYTYLVSVDDKPIGTCALMNVDMRNRHAELSIVIGEKEYWSKGYGSQIMEKLLAWGFEGLNLRKLYLHVFAFNKRAINLYEKFNFKKEGTLKEMLYRNGEYHDVYAYGLFKDDYKQD
ncbi:MAG TPA: GNAT family protein, partial [Erysipelothrix sp.]|nr:GNAT family protein [Erysipelothrix sp.]